MKPIYLEMKAFGSYKDAAIDFSQLQGGIFLITGNTGAGKTTIFDAITYALYGESSGGRRSGSMMRSQLAQPDQVTSVLYRFSYGGKIYEIRRRPEQPKYKQEKDGSFRQLKTNLSASVSLILPDGSEHPGSIAAVNHEIEKIIGLDKAQFTQIAMIAQGDFLKLLLASSDDRRKIFARIFDTEIYRRIEQELKGRCDRQWGALAQNKDRIIQSLNMVPFHGDEALKARWETYGSSRFSENDPEGLLGLVREILDSWQNALKDLEAQKEAITEKRNETDHRLQTSRQLSDWFDALLKAENVMKELTGQAAQIRTLKDQLDAHRRAQDLQGPYAELNKARKDKADAGERLQELEAWVTDHQMILEEAKEKAAAAGSMLADRSPELTGRIEGLQADMPRYKRLAELDKEKKAFEADVRRLNRLSEKEAAEMADLDRQITALAGSLDHDQEQVLHLAELKPEKDRLDSFSKKLEKLGRAGKDVRGQEKKLEKADLEAAEAREEAQKAAAAYAQVYEAVMKDQARMLAMTLKEGSPCPVCGSIYHGGSAACQTADEKYTGEALDAVRAAREAADSQLVRKRTNLETIRAKLDMVRDLYQSLYAEIQQEALHPQDLEDLQTLRLQTDRRREELKEEIERLAQLQAKLPAAREKLAGLKASAETLKAAMARHEAECQAAGQKAAAADAAYKEAASHVTFADQAEAEKALKEARDLLDRLKKDEQEARAAESRWTREMAAHEGQRQQAADRQKACEEALAKALSAFAEGLKAQELADETAYKAALLSSDKAAQAEQKIQDYQNHLATTRNDLERLKEITAGKEKPDLKELEKQMKDLDKQLKALKKPVQDTSSAVTTCANALTSAEKLYKERAQLSVVYRDLRHLSDTAGGNIPGKKLRFETYIQRRFFISVISCANKRLLKMNGGRFALDCRELGQGKGNAYIGLDLDVKDMISGQMRDVKSLSGGESFLASLSMALGMADLIRMQRGRVQLETMFIDEGFGSLSDDVRGKAVEVLNELSGGKSLIGIISHVSELKSQIDTQLLVSKDAGGSHARWTGDGGETI